MERYYTQTIGANVFSEAGVPVGRVSEVVIDQDTGKIAGFLIGPKGEKAVAPSDVLFWNRQIIINGPEDILDTIDLVKVQYVLEKKIPIIKNKVMTKSGIFLGNVIDFAMNTKFFILTKIVVAKSFIGIFPYDEKMIAYKNILEIKKDKIIVKNPLGLIPVKEKPAEEKPKLQIDIAPST